jgi:hypothetical protein
VSGDPYVTPQERRRRRQAERQAGAAPVAVAPAETPQEPTR